MKTVYYLFIISFIFISCKEENKEVEIPQSETKIVSKILDDINLSSGTIHRIENFPSEFVKPRNVDVWLPENYSKEKKYAVVYMHDGQMLFDANKTWNKQEWKVDEFASTLMKEGKTKDFIVVAIWNIQELRNSNYFPEKVFEKMSKKDKDSLHNIGITRGWINTINSDNYLKFIVEKLKPYVDSNFSTLLDKESTVIMGSSRGGLISMYAISEYPKVFGGAACLSTHWIGTYNNENNQIPDAFLEYMDNNLPDSKTHKMYFDYGTETLDAMYLPYQALVNAVLKKHGYETNLRFEGANHSENSWQKRLDIPLTFLLGKNNYE